ncbi:MAG: hypothetical protein KKA84_01165 [Bacteroidetes bacterium]|nr:hypothetical protein [Bacteroidota bacterium]
MNINDDSDNTDYELSDIVKGREQRLTKNDFRIGLNEKGLVSQRQRSYIKYGWPGSVYGAGLWISGYQNGEIRANVVGIGENTNSSFDPVIDSEVGEVYYVLPSMIENPFNEWPESFPKNLQNEPKLFGSEMCWVQLKSATSTLTGIHSAAFDGLSVSQSIYCLNEDASRNAVFIRYEIENKSEFDLRDVYLGFYRDIDLFFGSTNGDYVGYDSQWQISYTFSKEYPPEINRLVGVGCAVLKTDEQIGAGVELYSHRYITRGDSTRFGEGVLTPESAYWALKGLDNNGDDMINPVSGETTRYALDGNPISRDGWVDDARDSRALISVGPISLESYGKTELLIVIYVAYGSDLSSLITNIKLIGSNLISNPGLWL